MEPNIFTSSGVFGVCGLCFFISASILAFSLSFLSLCICILLAFPSASLLASFSLYCFAVIVALFLSSFGLSPWTILFMSISSSSGTFHLCNVTFVLGFTYSLRAECLLVFALSLSLCLCFCPHILYTIIFLLAKSK